MAYLAMAYMAMAYIAMHGLYSDGLHSHGLHSYGAARRLTTPVGPAAMEATRKGSGALGMVHTPAREFDPSEVPRRP